MVSPVSSSSKSFFTPSSSAQLGTVYLSSGSGDRISLSGKRSSENEALAVAVTTLKVTERALGQLVDITDKMLSLTAGAMDLNTTDIRRQGLDRKFNALVDDFRDVITKTKNEDGVDLTDRGALDETLAKAGLVEQIGGTIGALISVLGGEDKKLDTEEITIEGFKFQDAGTTKRFQQTFSMLLSNMSGVRVSNDAKKGGEEVSGTIIVDSGSVLFTSSANYQLNNAAHYDGIAEGTGSTQTPTVTYNGAPPSADLTILDADSAGRYTAAFNDDGSTEKIQLYDRQTSAVVRDLLVLSGGGTPQAAISGDGNNLVYYEDTGSATTLYFSDDQGATSSSIAVIGGTIEGRVAASDTIAAFSSNATSLGADGSEFDLFITNGYASPTTTRINIKGLEIGAALNTDSISISNDGSTVAFSVDTAATNGKLYLYDVATGECACAGIADVTRTSLDDDGSRIAASSNAAGAAAVNVYDVSFTPAGSSAVYTLSSEQPSGQIQFASVLGTSSNQAFFSTITDYLGLNTANKIGLAEATNAGGVTGLSLATEFNMRIQSIDDAGQYGIVTLGRWVDGAPLSSGSSYNVIWDFVNNTQVSPSTISTTDAHSEISADGNYWASVDPVTNEIHWGARPDDYSSAGPAVGGNVAVSNNRFAFVSNDPAFGGDGSRWDLFYSDSYGEFPIFDALSAGLTEDVVHDASNYNTIAISDDGNRIAFVGATTGTVYVYDINMATKYDTAIQLDLSQGAKFSIDLNSDGSYMAVADESTDTVSLYGIGDPGAPVLQGSVQLTNGDELDAKRVFLDAAGQNISFAADLGEGRVEVFEATAAAVGAGTAQISYEGQSHDIAYSDMNVSLVTTQGVVSTANDTFFASTGSNLVLSSRANYLSSNIDEREALWHADSSGITSEETTLASEADRLDQNTTSISSDGTWGVRQLSIGTTEFFELSTGKVGTVYDLAAISTGISPDGIKGAYCSIGGGLYLSSDVQNNGAPTLLGIGGSTPQKLGTADNSVAFVSRTANFGGSNVEKELFYTTGGDGYGSYTSVQKVALGGASISDTAFSFSQDGGRIFFADTTGAQNFYSYSTASTTTTDTGLDGVSAVAANADGSRAAVVRTVGANQFVQIFNMSDPSAPALIASEDVTGATITNLSLNSAGDFAGYVINGGTDSFKTLLATAASAALTGSRSAALGSQTATEVSLSGDGTKVAYNVAYTGSTHEVFMSTVDETTEQSYYFKAGQVQRSYVPGEDEDDVPRPDAEEPLNQSLTTRGRATLADLTIKKLRDALEKDKERIAAILQALGGKEVASLSDPDAVAQGVLENMAESGKFHKLDPNVVVELLKD